MSSGTVLQQRYRVDRLLAKGGMSEVFLATQVQLDSPVVIKVLKNLADEPGQQRAFVERFRVEAQILARLQHPHLARVTDFFEEEGRACLVMDYIEGQNLHEVVQAAPKTLRQRKVLEWAEQILDALEYLHTQEPPVVVRDLKPQNILLARSDWRIRVIDFGLARYLTPDSETETVLQGMGSLGYAPLEQYGQGSTDQRTDYYSLGATLYYLLTGRNPVAAHLRVTGAELTDPRRFNPTVTEEVWAGLQRLLALYPDQRPDQAEAARRALGLPSRRGGAVAGAAQPGPDSARAVPRPSQTVTSVRLKGAGILPLAFSSTGRMMASTSSDQAVRVWEVSTGREMRKFKGHRGEVHGLAFSPDERLLATGGEDGSVLLWDLAARATILSLGVGAVRTWVRCVAFSRCGRMLAAGAADGSIRVWEVPSGQRLADLRGHGLSVVTLAFFPSSRLLASGSWDDTVRLWYLPEGKEANCMRGHSLSVVSLAISPDGTRLASGSWDRSIRLWDVPGRAELECWSGHDQAVTSLAFSPDGRRVVSGSWDGRVRLWDVRNRARHAVLEGHAAPVTAVGISPSGRLLLSASKDASIRLWRI